MPRYHLNTHSKPAICNAERRPCPLLQAGGQHFDTIEEAQIASDAKMAAIEAHVPLTPEQYVAAQVDIYSRYDARGRRSSWDSDEKEKKEYYDGFAAGQKLREAGSDIREVDHSGHSLAFRLGVERGINTNMDASDNDYITRGIRYDYHRTYTEAQAEKVRNTRILHNPFKDGEEVFIPAGTPYDDGSQKKMTARATKIRVHSASQGGSDAGVGRITMIPSSIHADPWRSYTLTPELLRANQKEVFAQPHAYESKLHDTRAGDNPRL